GAPLPPLSFAAWVKGGGPKDSLDVTLTLSLQENDPGAKKDRTVVFHTLKRTFAAPADWARIAFDLTAADIAAALKGRRRPAGLIPAGRMRHASGTGKRLTLDDVELLCPDAPAGYTLIRNGGFEQLNRDGRPADWALDRKSLRSFGSTYYVWRDWHHF